MKEQQTQYLLQQIRTLPERLRRFTHDIADKAHPKRVIFKKLSQYIDDFLNKKSHHKMVIMPGFRGVGKTTLMAQLCTTYQSKVKNILFLSVEDAQNLFDMGIAELISTYEDILGEHLESVKEPILIFLDEIQSDAKWAITLKSLFEKTTNIFFCCTGSSAVVLQTTSNLARRALFEKIPPVSFTEYEMIENGIEPDQHLQENIRQAVYFSKDANEVFSELSKLKQSVNHYWMKIKKTDLRKFLSYGTLPFAITMPNEITAYDSISLLLDKIIKLDLPILGNFSTDTLNSAKKILFALAENDTTSLVTLEKNFHINRSTISSLLDALEKAELLIKIPAYGCNMTAARKPSKYLFMSPAIRMSFFYLTGLEATFLARQGKLLEDLIGGHLYREFILKNQGGIRYDSEEGGADFILQILNNKQIIIEVGLGNKDKKQIINTMKKINSDYNLIFSNSPLKINEEFKTVFIPLDYFLLI